jgi:hypothetical protein
MSTVLESPQTHTDDLVSAVRTLDKAYQKWLSTDDDSEFPPTLVKAISVVAAIVTTGFPKDDRLVSLFLACANLATAFQDVLNEKPGSARTTVAAIDSVCKFLDAHESQQEEAPQQSVASLLAEWKNQPNRYVWVARQFGEYDADQDIWRGPFFNRAGVPMADRIEKEAASPGSVLGEGFTPNHQAVKNARIKAAALSQLANLQAGLFRPEGGAVPEKASVLDQLKDGQYPDVISRVSKVPLSDVLKIAADNGITVSSRDDDLGRAAAESFSDPIAEASGFVKPSFDTAPDDFADDDQPFDVDTTDETTDVLAGVEMVQTEPAKLSSSELEQFTLDYLSENEDATAQDILIAAVETTGKSASRQMLSPILKKLRGA